MLYHSWELMEKYTGFYVKFISVNEIGTPLSKLMITKAGLDFL